MILGKQPVLSEYGAGVREAIRKLPPEVSKELLSEYKAPSPALLSSVQAAIIGREFAIENAAKGVNLDREWAEGGMTRRLDEVGLAEEDSWNRPEA
ncbi:hypothetical protein BAU07_26260 (plasmid) [Bordetella flabilis]|uniref:Uncharacterized protein n=1 Tax=Bordetella flabilis TaxID=463014 RepID=A0A193GLD0_9BORD|nr:hypothetical protein BAU07_26260 [Bordetella flabilis]